MRPTTKRTKAEISKWKRNRATRLATIKRENRKRQDTSHRGRAAWRAAPATAEQIAALRQIAMENGHTYAVEATTRGQAWIRIKRASVIVDEQLRARCAPPWYTAPSTKPTAR